MNEGPGSSSSGCRGCSLGWPRLPCNSEVAVIAIAADQVRLVCEEDTWQIHFPRAALIGTLGEQAVLDAMYALSLVGDEGDLKDTVESIVAGDLVEEECVSS